MGEGPVYFGELLIALQEPSMRVCFCNRQLSWGRVFGHGNVELATLRMSNLVNA